MLCAEIVFCTVQVLAKDGITVRGISRKGNPRSDARFTDYLSADPTNLNEQY